MQGSSVVLKLASILFRKRNITQEKCGTDKSKVRRYVQDFFPINPLPKKSCTYRLTLLLLGDVTCLLM